MLLIRFPARLRSFKFFSVCKPWKCRQHVILKTINSDHPGYFLGCSTEENRDSEATPSHFNGTWREFEEGAERSGGEEKRSERRNNMSHSMIIIIATMVPSKTQPTH